MTESSNLTEFAALLAEHDAALCGFDPENKAHAARLGQAFGAVLAARPIEPAAMAAQLRWIVREDAAGEEESVALLEHIAEQLEALAGAATS